MAGRWLRRKTDGTIFPWNEILSARATLEEVTEEVAFPEKFLAEVNKGRVPVVSLADEVVPDEATTSAPDAVGQEVTRSIRKAFGVRKPK